MRELTPQQLRKLKRIAEVLDGGNEAFLEHIFDVEDELEKKIEEIRAEINRKMPDLEVVLKSVRGKQGEKGEKGEPGNDGKDGASGKDGRDGKDGAPGRDGKDGRDGYDGKDGKDGVDGEKGEPGDLKELAPQEVRDLLELLQDEERLDASAIKNLDKYIKHTITPGGGIVGRDIIKDYDLSPYLDGVTKTFNIPGTWNIISVDTSSFPHALRKNIDYTWTTQTITFTSQIDAATTLASGQTVILTIVSA